MGRKSRVSVFIVVLAGLVVPLPAEESDLALSVRVGIPTDTLVNLEEMYHFGIALEAGLGWQIRDMLILGGQLTYGVSFGKAAYAEDCRHEVAAAIRLGYGSLESFSVSMLAGILIMFPDSSNPFLPNIGFTFDYRRFSLGISFGAVSLGMNFRL